MLPEPVLIIAVRRVPGPFPVENQINDLLFCILAVSGHLDLGNADRKKQNGEQKQNAEKWNEEIELFKLNGRMEIEPNYWVYGVLSDNKVEDMLRFREQGFYASGVHLPNTFYSVFGDQGQLPGVTEFNNKFIALPCGWWFEK